MLAGIPFDVDCLFSAQAAKVAAIQHGCHPNQESREGRQQWVSMKPCCLHDPECQQHCGAKYEQYVAESFFWHDSPIDTSLHL